MEERETKCGGCKRHKANLVKIEYFDDTGNPCYSQEPHVLQALSSCFRRALHCDSHDYPLHRKASHQVEECTGPHVPVGGLTVEG